MEFQDCLSFLPASHNCFVYTTPGTRGYGPVSLAAIYFGGFFLVEVFSIKFLGKDGVLNFFREHFSSDTSNLF